MKYFIHFLLTIVIAGSVSLLVVDRYTQANKATLSNLPEMRQHIPTTVDLDDFQQQLLITIEQSKKSVVNIIATKDIPSYYGPTQTQEIGGGSGILTTKDGYIISNKHVIEDSQANYTAIFADGSIAVVQQLRSDPIIDIAVLKIDSQDVPNNTQPAQFVSFDQNIPVGTLTIAIGNALNQYQNSVTLGIISGRNRTLRTDINERNIYAGLYQTDASISQGNSGGPLIALDGQVIGVNTAVSSEGENIGFAIPVTREFADATINSIKQNNQIIRPFVGIRYLDINRTVQTEFDIDSKQGILIMEVVRDAAADTAGLQKDDIITAINGLPIDDANPFLYHLYAHQPGDTLTLTVLRNKKNITTTLALGNNTIQ